ncbi:MAG TPA: hypothetical protein VG454_16325 [Gemmatimonadales bacterium]|nr:hypothetical protein [Gemmatimonadales bacterium]
MDGTAPQLRSVSPVLRALSALGGILAAVVGLIVSFGSLLAAPLGIWLVRRWRRRHERRPSRLAALFGGIAASTVLAAILWSILFASMPREEIQTAVERNRQQRPVKLPAWYTKAFPQAARADSATQQMIASPGFVKMTFVLGAAFAALFFGAVGGATGWGSYTLLRIAWSGQREIYPRLVPPVRSTYGTHPGKPVGNP